MERFIVRMFLQVVRGWEQEKIEASSNREYSIAANVLKMRENIRAGRLGVKKTGVIFIPEHFRLAPIFGNKLGNWCYNIISVHLLCSSSFFLVEFILA